MWTAPGLQEAEQRLIGSLANILNPAVGSSLCNILEISENRQLRSSSILVTSDRWYSVRQIKAFAEFQ
jgi:hypothetical protein